VKIVLTQPYVAAYRRPLLERVHHLLAQRGHQLVVLAGRPSGDQAARGDLAHAPWVVPLEGKRRGIGGAWMLQRTLPDAVRDAQVLVTELDVHNALAWTRSHGVPRVVLWGHGKSYVNGGSWVADRLRARLARRADHVMTYTPGGRGHLEACGVPADHITAIGNAVDTAPLLAARDGALADGTRDALLARWGAGPHALFVGGLDASKRIGFVLDAARAMHAAHPDSRLVVCGDGADRALVEEAAREGAVVYQGAVNREELGRVAAAARAVWMPGRVGLVAVDALALHLPVHTTDFAFHAPEFEYLTGDSVAVLPDSPDQFAAAAWEAMAAETQGLVWPQVPSIDQVAQRFVDVVVAQCAGVDAGS